MSALVKDSPLNYVTIRAETNGNIELPNSSFPMTGGGSVSTATLCGIHGGLVAW